MTARLRQWLARVRAEVESRAIECLVVVFAITLLIGLATLALAIKRSTP